MRRKLKRKNKNMKSSIYMNAIESYNESLNSLKNDEKEEGNLRYGIYKQPLKDGVLAFRIEDAFKRDDFMTKSRLLLKTNPPNLVFEDNDGSEVKISLTEDVSSDLESTLSVINKAYKGIQNKKVARIKDINYYLENWREIPVNTIILIIATLALIISLNI